MPRWMLYDSTESSTRWPNMMPEPKTIPQPMLPILKVTPTELVNKFEEAKAGSSKPVGIYRAVKAVANWLLSKQTPACHQYRAVGPGFKSGWSFIDNDQAEVLKNTQLTGAIHYEIRPLYVGVE